MLCVCQMAFPHGICCLDVYNIQQYLATVYNIHVYNIQHTCLQHTTYMSTTYNIHDYNIQHTCLQHTTYMSTTYNIHVYNLQHTCLQPTTYMSTTYNDTLHQSLALNMYICIYVFHTYIYIHIHIQYVKYGKRRRRKGTRDVMSWYLAMSCLDISQRGVLTSKKGDVQRHVLRSMTCSCTCHILISIICWRYMSCFDRMCSLVVRYKCSCHTTVCHFDIYLHVTYISRHMNAVVHVTYTSSCWCDISQDIYMTHLYDHSSWIVISYIKTHQRSCSCHIHIKLLMWYISRYLYHISIRHIYMISYDVSRSISIWAHIHE